MENERNKTLVNQDICSYYKEDLGHKFVLKPNGL